MTIQLGVIMDPIQSIHYEKDSTLAMLWEAKNRGWEIFYMEQKDLFLLEGQVQARTKMLNVFKDPLHWFELGEEKKNKLNELDLILMRKDPPFDLEYIYTTYLLEQAAKSGARIFNRPQSLRDINEKLFITWFPECCPLTLITSDIQLLKQFLKEHEDIVCKPLNGMGGASIFRVRTEDENASVIFETLTAYGRSTVLAQIYLPEIKQGDKRILMIDGEPYEYALARIPAKGELRGNLAAGGTGHAQLLTERDRWICQQVGPVLREKGIVFAGLDVIGNYLTEINVTSPTCIRELDKQTGSDICKKLFDCLERMLETSFPPPLPPTKSVRGRGA